MISTLSNKDANYWKHVTEPVSCEVGEILSYMQDLKFGTHIGSDSALSWLFYKVMGQRSKLTALEKVMILIVF